MRYLSIPLFVALLFSALIGAGPVFKTGQTAVYRLGDDGSYQLGRDQSYTVNPDGTVKDNVTGLLWQNDYSDNGNVVPDMNQTDAIGYCAALGLGGYSGWRLPRRMEMLDLAYYARFSPDPFVTDPFLATTLSNDYWTGTDYGDGSAAMYVYAGASVGVMVKNGTAFVRCVRGALAPGGAFSRANGIVTDLRSGLRWQDDYDGNPQTTGDTVGQPVSWADAVDYCEGIDMLGYSDWRLPNINELESIADDTRNNPSIDPLFVHTEPAYYWSSTVNYRNDTTAWGQNFSFPSSVASPKSASSGIYVRCVRGDQFVTGSIPVIMYLLN